MTARATIPSRDEVGPDDPLRLDVAATLAFPRGGMTASGLRKEHARGRLVIERIAGKDFTTLANIANMRALCRDDQPRQGSTSAGDATVPPNGSSSIEDNRSALARLKEIAQGLKKPSKRTLERSTGRTSATVIPLASR